MRIRVAGIVGIFAITLTGCSPLGQGALGNDPASMESLLITEQDISIEIAEVLDDPVFFGLDYGLLPSSKCDEQVGEDMLLATTNKSVNFRFENQNIENYSGYIQQQVVGFEEEGIGESLFVKIRELASSGQDCDLTSDLLGLRFVVDYKPVVNLPDATTGFEWSEASYPNSNRCSEGYAESGFSRYSVLSQGNFLVITKVWNAFCYSGAEDHDEASGIVDRLHGELLDIIVPKL